MKEEYSEVLEQLRHQHTMNSQMVHNRNTTYYNMDRYDKKQNVQDIAQHKGSWTLSFTGKIFLFLIAVFLFSFYLYGGQDLTKGMQMVYADITEQIYTLETKYPELKEYMDVAKDFVSKGKTTYEDVKEYVVECFEADE